MKHVHKLREITGPYRYECAGCGARFTRKPAGATMAAKPADTITDRAKRYRANRNPPPGKKMCNFCASRQNVDIDHVTGDESDGTAENLIYLCRPCNTQKGIVQARNRIGVRTRQYNPWKFPTFAQFKHGAAVLLGFAPGDVGEATELVRSTPPDKRAAFAEKIEAANPFRSDAQRRKFYAMAARGEISQATLEKFRQGNPAAPPTFAQYAHGVSIHDKKTHAHDEGGAIIHATPPALRRKYARQIAGKKRKRSHDEVPF